MDPATTESLVTLGYWVSTIGFVLASLMMLLAARGFGKSALGQIFTHFAIGTGIFLVVTIFQALGAQHFGIADESMDIWWHFMFYMAILSYFFGLKALVGLGTSESGGGVVSVTAWGGFVVVALAVIFVIPSMVDSSIIAYTSSALGSFGLHHFVAFLLAGVVAVYLMRARTSLGQIGQAIANPFIIAIAALSLQHFWELLVESWGVIDVTPEVGEGVEKIFLTIAALCMTYAAWRLYSSSRK